ncbi:hypothetical protein FE810_15065 [Thalassotalea litorea]|uniref:Exopolysaccharide biosynthesis protein n=1 Tax=Thalassotalea litorea TaxID=2020715 RepID=A0A5R9IMW1_9GAMM|nr:hypothetical protein [Thalassotalea litorea]TLU61329.1 hypothetical protein FE810_15065 [Thalassotalea litorea]
MVNHIIKISLLILLLSGCTNIRFTTNTIDWLESGFEAQEVETYSFAEIMTYNATYLGSVSEEYCHTKKLNPAPTFTPLVKELKIETQKLGGNAIVLNPCEKIKDYSSCSTLLRCNASAYSIDFNGV